MPRGYADRRTPTNKSILPDQGSYGFPDLANYLSPPTGEIIIDGQRLEPLEFIILVTKCLHAAIKGDKGPLDELLNSEAGQLPLKRIDNSPIKNVNNNNFLILLRQKIDAYGGEELTWEELLPLINTDILQHNQEKKALAVPSTNDVVDEPSSNSESEQTADQTSPQVENKQQPAPPPREITPEKTNLIEIKASETASLASVKDIEKYQNPELYSRVHLTQHPACTKDALETIVSKFKNLKVITCTRRLYGERLAGTEGLIFLQDQGILIKFARQKEPVWIESF